MAWDRGSYLHNYITLITLNGSAAGSCLVRLRLVDALPLTGFLVELLEWGILFF